MSTFAHMNTSLVFNQTLKVELPPNWNHFFSEDAARRTDNSLPGIQREIHEGGSTPTRRHGEVWVVAAEGAGLSTPCQRVVSGTVQMYVLSGIESIQKNGKEMYIRPGEKVSFHAGDTFSIGRTKNSTIVVLNEDARFIEGTPSPTPKLKIPSNDEVEATRAALGLHDTRSEHISHRSQRDEETSSRAYRGNRRPY